MKSNFEEKKSPEMKVNCRINSEIQVNLDIKCDIMRIRDKTNFKDKGLL